MVITPEIKKTDIVSFMPISAKNAVECKLPITEDEVSSVIFISARANLDKTECGNGEIRYGGKVSFYLMLSGGGMKKCEAGVEFSYKQEVSAISEGDVFVGEIATENVKVTSTNGIPTVSAMLILTGVVNKKSAVEYVKDLQDVNVKKCQAENLAVVACEKKEFSIEEEFDVDYAINEVLWHGETLKVNNVASGIGAVTIEGEVEVSSLLLVSEDKTEYFKNVIPFVIEHELKSSMPDLVATSSASIVDANLKVVVDRAKGRSAIAVILKISSNTCLYENEVISYVSDAYSETNYLSVEKTPVTLSKTLGESVIEKKFTINEFIKFEKSALLVCPIFGKIEEIGVECERGTAKIKGVARLGALVSVDGAYSVETALAPFEIETDAECGKVELLRSVIHSISFELAEDKLDVNFTVSVAVQKTVETACGFVINAECKEERVKSTSAISVFIPNVGDTLWDVAKALGIKEEEILKTNSDLEFPLTGEERIVIYREI